jgi:surfeit locus 1 family protein
MGPGPFSSGFLSFGPFHIGPLRLHVNLLILLCVISSAGMFASLGFWQLDRADEKRTLARDVQLRSQAEPRPLSMTADAGGLAHMTRVSLSGEYLNEIPFLLLFQFFQGQAGYEVITPFRADAGGPLILISRGWIAPGAAGGLPDIPAVDGSRTITVQAFQPDIESPPVEISDSSWPVRLSRLNIEQASRLLGEPVFPQVLRLDAAQAGVLTRHWTYPRISTRSHLAYAVQWFGLTLLVLVGSLFYASNLADLIRGRDA